MGANFVQLAIVPLPYLMDYHVEWVTQMLKIISILAFVADANIKVTILNTNVSLMRILNMQVLNYRVQK